MATEGSPDLDTLRRCLSDVVALSTLSAIWAGASRLKISESLAQVLYETLDPDLVFVGLREASGVAPCDSACTPSRLVTTALSRHPRDRVLVAEAPL